MGVHKYIESMLGSTRLDSEVEGRVLATDETLANALELDKVRIRERTKRNMTGIAVGVAGGLIVIPALSNLIDSWLGKTKPAIDEAESNVEAATKAGSFLPDLDSITGRLSSIIRKWTGFREKQVGEAKAEPIRPPSISMDLSKIQVVQPSRTIAEHIAEASAITGVDKGVLLAIAHQESRFKANAKSSIGATGLFQFTGPAWRDTVKKYGKKHGVQLKDIANPKANALMGAYYIRDIINGLTRSLGRKPSVTDIYAGHFLGPTGVGRLLAGLKENPNANAVKTFPAAAKHNPSIFKDKAGKDRTLLEVYAVLYGKVGAQYMKFAGNSAKYEPVTLSYAMPDEAREKIEATAIQAVPVSFDAAKNYADIRANTKPEVDATTSPNVFAGSQPRPEYNFIRKDGRLINIGK